LLLVRVSVWEFAIGCLFKSRANPKISNKKDAVEKALFNKVKLLAAETNSLVTSGKCVIILIINMFST
tara:strand:- start:202 stop:405 length:204 start_codon:yes stop_codon:yes gene_type:complete